MPCIHCARRDITFSSGATSTSSRCEQAAPLQRVPHSTHKQLQQHLRRSRAASKPILRQCQPCPQHKLHQLDDVVLTQDHVIRIQNSQRLGRCMLQGFAAAAVFSLLAPGPSYSAETLPIGLLKTWVVSTPTLPVTCCLLRRTWGVQYVSVDAP